MRSILNVIFLFLFKDSYSQKLEVDFGQDLHDFQIKINGETWFSENLSGHSNIKVSSDWKTLSTSTKDLKFLSANLHDNKKDVIGSYSEIQMTWSPNTLGFKSSLKIYQDETVMVFSQQYNVSYLTLFYAIIGGILRLQWSFFHFEASIEKQ